MSHVQERDDDVNDGFFDLMIRRRRTEKKKVIPPGFLTTSTMKANGQKEKGKENL
jgi:hypothetical protein